MPAARNLTGKRFGKLVAICDIGKRNGHRLWLCRCDCGRTCKVSSCHLTWSHTKSCGCIHKESLVARNTTHGRSGTPEHRIWKSMRTRCHNKNLPQYHLWGGKGVKVCAGWSESFDNFLRDMGRRPTPQHSIDRIDGNGHYSCGRCDECKRNAWPPNCRWATARQQAQNMRRNRNYTINGETKCVTQWAREFGIPHDTVFSRLKRGLSIIESLGLEEHNET